MGQAGEVKLDNPRPLNTAERQILAALLAVDFPGAEALRAQAERAQVVGRCDCGCPTIDLRVPDEVPSSPVATLNRLAPVEGRVPPRRMSRSPTSSSSWMKAASVAWSWCRIPISRPAIGPS